MNYSDKFGATSFQEVSSPFAKGDFDISIPGNAAAQPTPSGFIKITDAELLFSGNYKREGSDLVISNDVRKLVVPDYFKGEVRPTLSSRDGATLSGNVIEALTGHVSYAQASGAPEPPKEIGSVAKLTGSATAIRNGVAVELNIGDKVYKGDVLQSGQGASLGITFIDGTAFSLSSNARMVLNEMVYDPNGSSNSSLLSLVQGTITFVAGQTAKNGNMRVDTPVATMGIRGTAVLVEIGADNGPTKFSVLVEPGNKVGSFNLYDKATGALLGSVSQAGQVTLVTPGGIGQQATAVELPKTIIDLQNERSLIKQVFEMFFPNYNDANPQGTKGIGSSVNNLANYLNGLIKVDPGTTLFKQDVNFLGLSGPVTVTATAVTTPPPIIITDATDIQPPEERGGRFTIADQIAPDSRIIPYIAGSGKLDTAEGPGSMPSGFPLRSLVSLNPQTGEITYNPADFRFLADGEQAIYTFSFQSQSDEFIFTKTLTLTIDGLNDAPIFTVENFAAPVAEPGSTDSAATFSKQGTLTFTDLDFSDVASGYTVQTLGVTATGTTTAVPNTTALLGFLNLNGVTKAVGSTQGVITQTFSAPASAFDYLAAGETVNLAYQISVTDADGASRTSTLTVTVTGTNDTPTITGATTPASTSGDLLEDGMLTASGVITFRDVDLSNTHTAVSALTGGTISTPLPGFNPATSMLGSLVVTANENPNDANNIGTVSWVYSLDNLIAQRLAEGQVVTQTFTVTITDSSGATVTQPVTVTITGANDVPEIVLSSPNVGDPVTIDTGAVTEEADVDIDGDISTAGIVVFKDVDLSDTHTASAVLKSADATDDLPGFSEGVVGVAASVDSVGTFTLDTGLIGDNTDLIDIGVVGWTFTVDNDHPVVQSLAAGQTITQVYTITITDSSGAAVTKDVTVTITGTNDAPTVDAAVVEILGEPTDASALSASIAVDFGDVDLIDTGHSATILGVSPTGPLGGLSEGDLLALVSPGTVTKASGSQTGTFDLNFSAPAGTFDYLADGETLTLVYGVQIDDGDGGKVNQTVSITITGSNDAPVVSTADVTGEITEALTPDGDLTDTGTISFSDADLTDDHVIAGVVPSTGVLGTLTAEVTTDTVNGTGGVITWHYTVSADEIEYLDEDQTRDETFTVTLSDGNGGTIQRTITVTITGTADGPVVNDVVSLDEGDITTDLAPLMAQNDEPGYAITSVTSLTNGAVTLNSGVVTFQPDANFSGQATFQYTASNGGTPTTASVTINYMPVVDTATVDATSSAASNSEGQTISLGSIVVGLGDTDGSETFVLKLSGFPAGATFSHGEAGTGDDADKWLITEPADISAVASGALTMTPPLNYNGTFTLIIDAVVTDSAVLTTGLVSVSDTFSDTIAVTFDPVNDTPALDLDSIDAPGTGFAGTVSNNGSLSAIAEMPTLADIDNAILDGVKIVLADGQAGDFLVVMDGSEPGGESGELDNGVSWIISGTADDPDEPLTITFAGGFSAVDYQFAIEQVMFGSEGGEAGVRHIEVTANDGNEDSNVAVAAIEVQDTGGGNSAPNAVDDAIVLRNDFFAVASSLTSNDTDPDAGDTVTISGLSHGATLAEEVPGGFKVQGLYGTLYVYSGNATNPIGGSINAGDYFFYLGQDINGDPIANNLADILQPDALLSDSFIYTVSDGHGGFDTANISLTIEPSPVHVTVLSSGGVDVTPAKLWSYLNDNDLVAISSSGLTIQVPDESPPGVTTVVIDAQNLTYTPPNPNLPIEDVVLTGGYIKSVHVAYDADGPGGNGAIDLYSATHFNIPAEAFYTAVMAQTPASFEALLATYAYLSNGGTGPDTLFGGDRADVIDTGGGADDVMAGGGNDVILVHDDSGWNIDGGDGIDTVRAAGSFVTGQGQDMGSELSNVEIIDLNSDGVAGAVSLLVDAEGAFNVNATHTGRILGDEFDTVNFDNYFEGHPTGMWIAGDQHVEFNPDNATPGVYFDQYFYRDGAQTLVTVYVHEDINVAPIVNFDSIVVAASAFQISGGNATLQIDNSLILQNDVDVDGELNVHDYPDIPQAPMFQFHGEASGNGGFTDYTLSTSLMPGGALNESLIVNDGFFYRAIDDATGAVSGPQAVNMVVSGLTHPSGAYIVPGSPLNDVIIGGNTADQFVFAGNTGSDVIINFQQGIDMINFQNYGPAISQDNIDDWLDDHAAPSGLDTLITFDANNSILVKNTALTANDFILHPGGGGNPYA